MPRNQRALAVTALALFAAAAAQAQVIGTYTGSTSGGGQAQIVVGLDGAGVLAVTGDNFNWTMNCRTGDQQSTAWGVGLDVPLTGKKATVLTELPFLWEKITMKFSADSQTVTGTFQGDEPMYVDISESKKVEECTGDKMTFTATLDAQAPADIKPELRNLKMKHVD